MNEDFLLLAWRKAMKTIESPSLHTANRNVEIVVDIVSLSVHMGDLRVRPWFAVVENLAVELLLGTSFIDCCILGLFSSVLRIVPSHFQPVATVSTQKKANPKTADTKEFDVYVKAIKSHSNRGELILSHSPSSHDMHQFAGPCTDSLQW